MSNLILSTSFFTSIIQWCAWARWLWLSRTNVVHYLLSSFHQYWSFEISLGESIYTAEIGKGMIQGLFSPREPVVKHLPVYHCFMIFLMSSCLIPVCLQSHLSQTLPSLLFLTTITWRVLFHKLIEFKDWSRNKWLIFAFHESSFFLLPFCFPFFLNCHDTYLSPFYQLFTIQALQLSELFL